MNQDVSISDTDEAWETGALGLDDRHVAVAQAGHKQQIDDLLGLKAISIRLETELIDKFKLIAKIHGMGYQPLMREVLKRFADSEIKVILNQMANSEHKQKLDNGKQKVEVELDLELDQRRAA
jgi:hypothetical protein